MSDETGIDYLTADSEWPCSFAESSAGSESQLAEWEPLEQELVEEPE